MHFSRRLFVLFFNKRYNPDMPTHDFEGKVVLITGAGKGKGRALAQAFAASGAWVAVNDISPVNLDELVSQSAGRIRAYVEDVAKKVAVQSIIKQVEDDFGRIDILINHASVRPQIALLDMDEWDWQRVLDVNLTGAFLMMQSAGRVMRAQGLGVIVNVVTANEIAVDQAAYLASVNGLIALTRSAVNELAPLGVSVHAVGTGIPEFQHADANIPKAVVEAVLYLCGNPSLQGQIVNVEE